MTTTDVEQANGPMPEEVKVFPCPDCDRVFDTKQGLGRHRTSIHGAASTKSSQARRQKREQQRGQEKVEKLASTLTDTPKWGRRGRPPKIKADYLSPSMGPVAKDERELFVVAAERFQSALKRELRNNSPTSARWARLAQAYFLIDEDLRH
jgi:uncharacterized C2H2 Zn-finger protein